MFLFQYQGGDATSAQNVGDLLLELESVKAKLDAVQGNMVSLTKNLGLFILA